MTTTIYVSNSGDDKNDGLTREKPVRSWARTKKLCTGNTEMHLLEGDATFERLKNEIGGTGPDATGETWAQTISPPPAGGLPPGR